MAQLALEAYPEDAFTFDWRPFELLPGIPANGLAWQLSPSEMTAFRRAIKRRATDIGATVTIPPFRPNTFFAHILGEVCRQEGRYDEYRGQVFTAYWQQQRDISSPDVLIPLATTAGATLHSCNDAVRLRSHGDTIARPKTGIEGQPYVAIPTIIVGVYRLHGVESFSNIRSALTAAQSATTAGGR